MASGHYKGVALIGSKAGYRRENHRLGVGAGALDLFLVCCLEPQTHMQYNVLRQGLLIRGRVLFTFLPMEVSVDLASFPPHIPSSGPCELRRLSGYQGARERGRFDSMTLELMYGNPGG